MSCRAGTFFIRGSAACDGVALLFGLLPVRRTQAVRHVSTVTDASGGVSGAGHATNEGTYAHRHLNANASAAPQCRRPYTVLAEMTG